MNKFSHMKRKQPDKANNDIIKARTPDPVFPVENKLSRGNGLF